jgi:hypothetical protein
MICDFFLSRALIHVLAVCVCSELTVVMAEAKSFERHMSGLGLRPGTKSIGVGILAGEGETTLKYRLGYDKDVSKAAIRQFAQRFVDKEEPVYVWSEPVPTAEEKAALAPVVKVRRDCTLLFAGCCDPFCSSVHLVRCVMVLAC